MNRIAPLFFFCLAAVYGCHSDLYIKDIGDPGDTETVSNIKDTSDANTNNDTGTTEDTDSNTNWDTDRAVVPGWSLGPGKPKWQWQMQGSLDLTLDVEVFIVELFGISSNNIQTLHDGKKIVICSFSAGIRESWTDDAGDFPDDTLGNSVGGNGDDKWVDIQSEDVKTIMSSRISLAASKGCDGVQPDNMDSYDNSTGLGITSENQLDYNRFLAEQAHNLGLAIGLTNDLSQIVELEPDFDWALNDSCLKWDECNLLAPFIKAGKTVFHVEYADNESSGTDKQIEVCEREEIAGFSTIIKTSELNEFVLSCY